MPSSLLRALIVSTEQVLMDRSRKGVRAEKGPRAENQFYYMEDIGTYSAGGDIQIDVEHPRNFFFAREVSVGGVGLLRVFSASSA